MKIAINGFGRIGRGLLRALVERKLDAELEVVAINDLAAPEVLAHLTRYDSTHGPAPLPVSLEADCLCIGAQRIRLLHEADPKALPWAALGVELVLECSGRFKQRTEVAAHLAAGAQWVLAGHPLADADLTLVYGVNHTGLDGTQQVVSNASCTTNCLAPVAMVIDRALGIVAGSMTTIHAYTNDQVLIDQPHADLYRARSATQSMIPTKTGAAAAVGLVLPQLAGKLDGMAVRVPTLNVSLVDLTVQVMKPTDVATVNQLLHEAAKTLPPQVLRVNQEPLVSIDFNHDPTSSVFDATQTRVQGSLLKLMAWYDNEWAYANRMLDVALYWSRV